MTPVAPRTYTVSGMSCEHCARSVREHVEQLAGVTQAVVELDSGRLTLSGDADDDTVRAAVARAGYEVTA